MLSVLLALCALLPPALASERVLAITGGSAWRESASRRPGEQALANLGYRQVSWIFPAEIPDWVEIVPLGNDGGDCADPLLLASWTRRLGKAQDKVQYLDLAGALGDLSGLDLDLPCLDAPPRQADIFLLDLITAQVNELVTQTASTPQKEVFHKSEVERALDSAATHGPDLPIPTWLDPNLTWRLAEKQEALGHQQAVTAVATVLGGEPFIDGTAFPPGLVRLPPGRHLLQAQSPDGIVRGRWVNLPVGHRFLVIVDPDAPPRSVDDVMEALERTAEGARPDPMLAGLLAILPPDGSEAALVMPRADGAAIWTLKGGRLVRIGADEPTGPSDDFTEDEDDTSRGTIRAPGVRERVVFGMGPAGQWTNLGGGALEGLGGRAGGGSIAARLPVYGPLSLALALHPVVRMDLLDPGVDGTWLVRAMIPGRLGLRWVAPIEPVGLELGADGGLIFLGTLDDRHPLPGFGAVAVGLGIPRSAPLALHVEAWGGMGRDLLLAGGQLLVAGQWERGKVVIGR